ncbi:COQ5 family methyltransferase [Pseudohyphozyma bogoriensis]|nr:COQ5 family methyltransferase [Pseudohyphozyma bogoriensis]
MDQSRNSAMEWSTSAPATALLKQAGLLPCPPENTVLLDNACGAGIVTFNLLKELEAPYEGLKVVAGDLENNMVAAVQARVKEHGWEKAVEAKVLDAQSLNVPDGCLTHNLMNFGPQLIIDAEKAMQESYRTLASSGIMGFTAWLVPGWAASVRLRTLTATGFTDIKMEELVFDTILDEAMLPRYLDLVRFLLKDRLGEEGGYEEHMGKEVKKGEVRMTWKALVVTARKA